MKLSISAIQKENLFFIILALVCVYLSWHRNFPDRAYKGSYEICCDKADYYIYLPATFIYKWDVNRFEKGIDLPRVGFTLDHKNQKIFTKTTCGVAILWVPFFLAAHGIALVSGIHADGFSLYYEHFAVIPGAIFLVLGLFFLRKFLTRYFPTAVTYAVVLLLFLGTNLYFYGIDEGLMSHIHSFFLFSLYLFLLGKFLDSEKKPPGLFIAISFTLSLAILIRPTNIIVLSWMVFLDVRTFREMLSRLRIFLHPVRILVFAIAAFIVFLPQFLYWKYLTGSFLYYSYEGESFTLWQNPHIIPILFSPLNSLFIYVPFAITFFAGLFVMIRRRITNGIFIFVFFAMVVYIFASWYCWHFGGSFGSRPLVEYYALLSIPLGYFLMKIPAISNLFTRSVILLFIILCIIYNLKMTYNYRWVTFTTWSWDDYLRNVQAAGLYHDPGNTYTYFNDFENSGMIPMYADYKTYYSPSRGGFLDAMVRENGLFQNHLSLILKKPVEKIGVKMMINRPGEENTGVIYTCRITDGNQRILFSKTYQLDDYAVKAGQWYSMNETLYIPEWIDQNCLITFVVQDPLGKGIYIDDQILVFE